MYSYIKCNNCGYDLSGPELLSNAVDTSIFNSTAMHSDLSVLELSQKSQDDIICPFCGQKGNWSF
ncbi:hypothetical protein [Candidatus Epulonipiscium viviparus]|uniref:hypothetical protein n=1 Tax=Candidatus Epulonipiscium viviparus TaxID=420336 RepID=UPI000494F603|nr:hypothetical protein [Candidatus Epulopiscium viviparus]